MPEEQSGPPDDTVDPGSTNPLYDDTSKALIIDKVYKDMKRDSRVLNMDQDGGERMAQRVSKAMGQLAGFAIGLANDNPIQPVNDRKKLDSSDFTLPDIG